MLVGLSSSMNILPDAVDGFALHPLDETSSLPALTNNRVEDGFPGSAVLPLNTSWSRTGATGPLVSKQWFLLPNLLLTGTTMRRITSS
jgi:hypothetical protein